MRTIPTCFLFVTVRSRSLTHEDCPLHWPNQELSFSAIVFARSPPHMLIRGFNVVDSWVEHSMARTLNRLTALAVSRAKDRGLYADGGGLALQVSKDGARSWVFRFMRDGRERCMGLGSLNSVGLAKARIKAAAARELLADGKDPIAIKDAQRAALAPAMTFQRAAAEFIAAHRSGWRSAAHAVQWEVTLATFAEPLIGALPV
jgi:hypothetical protein